MHKITDVVEFLKIVNVYTLVNRENVYEKFLEYYTFTFNEQPNCNSCPNDIEQAIHKLNWIVKLHIKSNKDMLMKADKVTKYTMKPNVRIYSSKLGLMVTRFNCTDAIAEALLKENANNSKLFTVNGEQLQAEPVAVLEKTVEPTPVVVETVEAEPEPVVTILKPRSKRKQVDSVPTKTTSKQKTPAKKKRK